MPEDDLKDRTPDRRPDEYEQPTVRSADGRREFATFPAAILVFVINDKDEVLLLSHPSRKGSWEVVNGAIEAGESPLDALHREVREEAGAAVQVKPVAAFHTFLYHFDARVPSMFSIAYAASYLGGDISPGSDMAMSDYRWAAPSEIEGLSLLVPAQQWMFRRAVAVHRILKDDEVELEPWQPSASSGVFDRALAAILFTDLVGSTDSTVKMGDARWVDLLQHHDRMAHGIMGRLGGRVVKSTGDGVLALFPSVANAVAAGKAVQSEARELGLSVRAGLHVGEVTVLSTDVAGQAVVMASRLCGAASADELLVSRTAADLLAGSGAKLDSPRQIELRGFGQVEALAATINPA